MIKNKKIKELFKKENLHLIVILLCMTMQMFTIGELYRFFAYLNLLIVVYSIYRFTSAGEASEQLFLLKNIILFPLLFCLLHFISQQEIIILKVMRHILLAICLAIAIAFLLNKSFLFIKNNINWIVASIISLYTFVQLIAIFVFQNPHGTTKNPHYLAFYSAICLILSVYFLLQGSYKVKVLSGVLAVVLGYLLLITGSRPTWIGLFVSALIVTLFFNKGHVRFKALVGLIMLSSMLSLTNIGNFSERASDLIDNWTHEERVTIWQNTWTMQIDSTPDEWALGHGLDSFEEDFKPYSAYHLEGIDFNSPHNYFIEILYISGVIGLILFLVMLFQIYRQLIDAIRLNDQYKAVYLVLFSIFTSSFIMASLTLPFFNSYSINVIAYVVGILYSLLSISKRNS